MEYPLEDFLRDFDTVTALAESEEEAVFMKSLLHLRSYMHHTYADDLVRTRRSMALAFSLNFLCSNQAEFDVGRVAVVGKKETIVTDHLLKALHALIVEWALNQKTEAPTPAMVRELALKYSRS